MSAPEIYYVEMRVSCRHCRQEQVVQVFARTGGGQGNNQVITCVKCGKSFDVTVPDRIVGGPTLP